MKITLREIIKHHIYEAARLYNQREELPHNDSNIFDMVVLSKKYEWHNAASKKLISYDSAKPKQKKRVTK